MSTLALRHRLALRKNLGLTGLLGGAQQPQPPAGHFFLKGENADTSHTILRGQTSAGVYVNLAGQ